MALFLVNLPFAQQTLTERRIEHSGQEVEAQLVGARAINGHRLVEYRLPPAVDPRRRQFSAQVDATTYAAARESRVLAVLVVPGKPEQNRPVGAVPSRLFALVAGFVDALVLLVALVWWWRRGRGRRLEVVEVHDGLVTLLLADTRRLTAQVPPVATARLQPGVRVSGTFHLDAEEDLLPGAVGAGLERLAGASYVARGRVLDAREGRARLELDDGLRLDVRTGPHRIRADIRDSTHVRGTLWFTPSRAG